MQGKAVVLAVDGIRIAGQLYLPVSDKPPPVVCICHGIPSGNPPDPADGGYPALAEKFTSSGFAAFIFNFRGCRNSGGNFDILGWSRDLQAVLGYLYRQPEIDKTHMALLGFSAGAAVSAYVAAGNPRISCVALCAGPAEFSFLNDPSQSLLDHFRRIGIIRDAGFPVSTEDWADGFKTVTPANHIAGIAPRPLLIIHGTSDDVVDISHARRLYAAAGEPKQMIIIEGAGHRLRQDEQAMKLVLDWLKLRQSTIFPVSLGTLPA